MKNIAYLILTCCLLSNAFGQYPLESYLRELNDKLEGYIIDAFVLSSGTEKATISPVLVYSKDYFEGDGSGRPIKLSYASSTLIQGNESEKVESKFQIQIVDETFPARDGFIYFADIIDGKPSLRSKESSITIKDFYRSKEPHLARKIYQLMETGKNSNQSQ
ncbi:MAG: hypothetical protein ACSHYA_10770 [Opitutaceae bacterium]